MRTQPQDIILELEADNSRLAKEAVLQKYMESSEGYGEFFEGVRMALDKLYTFGVQQVPQATEDGQGLEWSVFKELAEKLQRRELTGHAARDAIELSKNVATVLLKWNNFYRRIPSKIYDVEFPENCEQDCKD